MKKNDNSIQILISRALDIYRESEYAVAVTDFMSPGEIAKVYQALVTRIGNDVSRCFFWGGCRGAERCAAVFLPEWYDTSEVPPYGTPNAYFASAASRADGFAEYLAENTELSAQLGISALRIKGSGFRTLSHRDFMGSILSLGVDRAVVGDIAVVSEFEAFVFVSERIAPFIASELTKIGRDAVQTVIQPVSPEYVIPRRYEETVITVASPRIDCVVKGITGKSREVCAELVRAGLAELNYDECLEVSEQLSAGDVLSIRGFGKYIIGEALGETRSGRVRMICKKYI